MNRKNTLFLAVSTILLLGSCKKDGGDDNTSNPAYGTWKTTSFMRNYTAPVVNTIDMYGNLSPCFQDDLFVLRANGTFETNEGATKCDPGFPQVKESGTFTLTNNNTRITLSNGWSVEISETPAATLKLKYTYTGAGSQYYDVIIYARQ
jgi:hypothetical protein